MPRSPFHPLTSAAAVLAVVTATPTVASARASSTLTRKLPATGHVVVSLDAPVGRQPGTIARFARNRIALVRTTAGGLAVRAARRRVLTRWPQRRRVHVRIELDAAASRISATVAGRALCMRRRLVAESAVTVARGVRNFKVTAHGTWRRACQPLPDRTGPKAPNPGRTLHPTPTWKSAPTTRPRSGPRAGADFRGPFFAPDSVWNKALAVDAPLDPSSARLVKTLRDTVAQNLAAGTGPALTHKYTPTLYVVPADQPTVRVQLDTGGWGANLQQALLAVPIPPNAMPAPGNDAQMTIWQPATDRMWELFRANKQSDGWHAAWGGAIASVSSFPGYYTTRAWPGLSAANWGATASSLPIIGGTIMLDELKAGVIPHALAINIPWALPKTYTWPAQRTDGKSTDANAIPEGAHFRLDPNLDLNKLDLPPVTRMIAQAAQRYGIIVRDQTGLAISFFAQNTYYDPTDPYLGPNGLLGGKTGPQIMQAFPWDHLQLLKMHLHHGRGHGQPLASTRP